MSYTDEEMQKMYDNLNEQLRTWEGIAEHWKGRAEAATVVLQEVEWTCGVCPVCFAWKFGPHKDAILNTGLPQRPEAPSDSEPEAGSLTLDGRKITLDDLKKELAKAGMCQPGVLVSWASYDELLTGYLKLARERVLMNALCVVSALVALIVLAVQVYKVLGRGY